MIDPTLQATSKVCWNFEEQLDELMDIQFKRNAKSHAEANLWLSTS